MALLETRVTDQAIGLRERFRGRGVRIWLSSDRRGFYDSGAAPARLSCAYGMAVMADESKRKMAGLRSELVTPRNGGRQSNRAASCA